MWMPACLAASRIVVPSGTLVSRPSIVAETRAPIAVMSWAGTGSFAFWLSGARPQLSVRISVIAGSSPDHGAVGAAHDLIAEVAHDRSERARACLPQAALRGHRHRLAPPQPLVEGD